MLIRDEPHSMMTRHYKVAGHTFAVSGSAGLFKQMGNYEPFECEGGEALFSLIADSGTIPDYTEVYQLRGLHFSPTLGCLKKICEGPTDWLSS